MNNLNYRTYFVFTLLLMQLILLFACQKKVDYPTLGTAASQQELEPYSSSSTSEIISAKTTAATGPSNPTLLESSRTTGPTTSPAATTSQPAVSSQESTSQATSQTGSSPATTPATSITNTPAKTSAGTSRPTATTSTKGTSRTTGSRPTTTQRPDPTTTRPAPTTTRPAQTTSRAATATSRPTNQTGQINYRQEMRDFVIRLSDNAKARSGGFLVVVQNGEDIIQEGNQWQKDYLSAVDGIGREDFLYGASRDDVATSSSETSYIKRYLDQFLASGNKVMIADYCFTPAKVLDSYSRNNSFGYISFAADQRELNSIPSYPQPVYAENNSSINSLAAAKNFLYLINPENFNSKSYYLAAIGQTDYDLVIVDLFYEGTALSKVELAGLKQKKSGGRRLVLAYMSIGEAEDYRYYWQKDWRSSPPSWLGKQNPNWPGNYLVKYWDPAWQSIIIDQSDSYLNRIINAGFDGVYLDLIDAYEYYS